MYQPRPYIPRGGRGAQNNGNQRGMRDSNRENRRIEIASYECPRDQEGYPIAVPMRFEVIKEDGASKSEIDDLQEFYINSLKVAARNTAVEVDVTNGEKLTVNVTQVEGMGHSRWVVHFKVSSTDWQKSLSRFAQEFLNLIKYHARKIPSHEMPVLFTHSHLIYPLRLINMHKDVPFRRIKFASFLHSGEVGIHWSIEGGKATEEDKIDGFTFYKDIDGSFEYDRRQITIFFHNREVHPDGGDEFLANYKLTCNMGSIKKIGMDIVEFSKHIRRSLVLHVDYPPKIQVKLKNEPSNGKVNGMNRHHQQHNRNYPQSSNYQGPNSRQEMTWSKYEHRLNICRGRYPGERSNRSALHESKLIFLELDEDDLEQKLVPKSDSAIDRFIFDLLSRLRHKTGKAVEFTSYDQLDQIEGKCRDYYDPENGRFDLVDVKPYGVSEDIDDHVLGCIRKASEKLAYGNDYSLGNRVQAAPRLKLKMFRLRALFEGILQRGMDIRCQLLIDRNKWYSFVEMVCERYSVSKEKEQMTLAVMENLLSIIAEGRPHCTVMALFLKEWEDSKTSHRRLTVFTDEEKKQGYTRVMKFVQTPTRLLFVGYETIMENRVLKQNSKNGTEIIRVSFRDDSGEYMREMGCGERIINQTMKAVLLDEGISFAGRRYVWLGNSNSQLRDHGIYMYHEEKQDDRQQYNSRLRQQATPHKTARGIRDKLGHFHKLTSIPKWLARQGQCFTQARASNNTLKENEVGVTHDFIGGENDKNKPYCFSDGVGTVAFSLADKLSKEHSLPRVASAFQIRHKGQKGLVAIDPNIDDKNDLHKLMGQTDMEQLVYVRPSMDKFEVEETSAGPNISEKTILEIVKYSMASPLFLNRPMLNILSQVSEDQSTECFIRMMNRVVELLDMQIRNTLQSLYMEQKARDTIKEMSFPFAMEVFGDACPLVLTSEPFFRSLLIANARYILNKQRSKMQIRIPSTWGRSMFGVVDTSGVLQYGQIFCQYSTSTSKHMSRSRSRKDGVDGAIILEGPVMLTKNPCIEKGDVRRFEAIDVPALRHLVDVVVFPMNGPRPHPDEMAGSDLDGDEYSLIWDPQMLFDHNEEASLFPSGEDVENWPIPTINGVVDKEACEKRLAEFYIEAVTQEQIGVLSNAHLATSDFYGLENKASRSLARKISQSLDFQKNGIRPEEMTREVADDPDNENRVIPPEKAARKPDYMEKMRDAGYESRGIMGDIYTEIKRYQFAINSGEDEIGMIVKDPAFDLPEWKKYEVVVKREMEAYTHGIKSLMENYGIVSEGELMSGQILSIKNRISEKEADDMNLYNTNQVIEEKLKREITAAREAFFKSIINWETDLEQVDNKRRDVDKDSILCRVVRSSTVNMDKIRLKAAAVYNVCYDAANKQLQNGEQTSLILSFPWVVYDVLADIKSRPDGRIYKVIPDEKEHSNEPLAVVISKFIDDYCVNESNIDGYEKFKRNLNDRSMIGQSIMENEGLARASYVLIRWARYIGGFQQGSKFTEDHLLGLFIKFGLGDVIVRGMRRRYIQPPSGETRIHLKKGDHLLKFIEYLSSREFRTLSSLSFDGINMCILSKGEWKPFAELVIPSYLSLVTTHNLDLPLDEESDTEAIRTAALIKEFEPRKMELPEDVIRNRLAEVKTALIKATGCTEIQLRAMGGNTECFVSALGTTESFKKLNNLIVPYAPQRQIASLRANYSSMPVLVYNRLIKAAAEAAPSLLS